jgi:hypothetical protein
VAGIFQLGIYFVKRYAIDQVHKLWTSVGHGPWWTGHHGRLWSSLELILAATPGHGYLPQGGEKNEGATGIQFCLVPRLGRRRTDGGTSARMGDVISLVRTRRRRVGGVGIFIGGRVAFYRAKARQGRVGVPSWPALKGLQ